MTAYVICFDTICSGYTPVQDGTGQPIQYKTEAEALAEVKQDPEFYSDCFVCELSDIGHKTIYKGEK